jgi:hypothetical protein
LQGLEILKYLSHNEAVKPPPKSIEKQPLAQSRYKRGCSRYAPLDELPQLCPVRRQAQTELSILSNPEGDQE